MIGAHLNHLQGRCRCDELIFIPIPGPRILDGCSLQFTASFRDEALQIYHTISSQDMMEYELSLKFQRTADGNGEQCRCT